MYEGNLKKRRKRNGGAIWVDKTWRKEWKETLWRLWEMSIREEMKAVGEENRYLQCAINGRKLTALVTVKRKEKKLTSKHRVGEWGKECAESIE